MATIPTWSGAAGAVATANSESVPSVSTSDGTNDSETGMDEDGTDAEGVWSPDIEQSFQEALAIYPPCGRRKIILSEEGKMYGRNELIARYIKLRTGKTRSRKQVSSHIQVLARRKSKDIHTQLKTCPNALAKERALQSLSAMSSSQIVSASSMRSPPTTHSSLPEHIQSHFQSQIPAVPLGGGWLSTGRSPAEMQAMYGGMMLRDVKPPVLSGISEGLLRPAPAWEGRSIAGPSLRLKEFISFLSLQTADGISNRSESTQNEGGISPQDHIFVELGPSPTYDDPMLEVIDVKQIYDKFPCSKGGLQDLYSRGPNGAFFLVKFWADLNINVHEDTPGAFYGVNMTFESQEQLPISCSTKVCSFGRQVVEKVETDHARYENGKYVYRFHRSPLCDYMITFIHKLKQLPEKYMMNSVLENFTILQVVQNKVTQETLLCIAFVFEISSSDSGCQHIIYRLVKE